MSGSSFALAAQLNDAQARLQAAERRVAQLEEENSRLRGVIAGQHPGDEGQRKIREAKLAAQKPGVAEGSSAEAAALVRELQLQLAEEGRRSTELERAVNERAAIQRRQYEAHIDALELELRRAKAGGRHLGQYSAGAASPAGGYVASPLTAGAAPGNTWGSPAAASRTPDTRKNLL